MNTGQTLAIVAAIGSPNSATLSYDKGQEHEYQAAVDALRALDVLLDINQNHSGGIEWETVNVGDNAVLRGIRLHGPSGYRSFSPDDRVEMTPPGKLSLRLLRGGQSEDRPHVGVTGDDAA